MYGVLEDIAIVDIQISYKLRNRHGTETDVDRKIKRQMFPFGSFKCIEFIQGYWLQGGWYFSMAQCKQEDIYSYYLI